MVSIKRKNGSNPSDSAAEKDEKVTLKRKVVLKRKEASTQGETIVSKPMPALKRKTESAAVKDATASPQPTLKRKEEKTAKRAETIAATQTDVDTQPIFSKKGNEKDYGDPSKPNMTTNLHENVGNNNNSGSTGGDEPHTSSGKVKWILAAVLAFALVAGGSYYYNSSKAEQEQIAQTEHEGGQKATGNSTKVVQDSSKTADNVEGASNSIAGGNNEISGKAKQGEGESNQPVVNQPEASQKDNSGVEKQKASSAPKQRTNREESVNDKSFPTATSLDNLTAEQAARQVIKGVYGNGQERKQKLGSRYADIQHVVNEMYRTGQVR